MSGARLLRSSIRCQSCEWHALNAFAFLTGCSLSAARPAARSYAITRSPHTLQSSISRRAYTIRHDIQATKADDQESEVLQEIATEQEVEKELDEEPASSLATSELQDPTIPWYLQVDQPERRPGTLAQRQKAPELPENPPERLEAMIEHLFTDIGLDDLRILDLRALDPPQALGANLIMVFGTARSERHLHTAADRFCRWLRSTYKLRPYPDGLLGRNELKIKLRRKARRMKLLGSKGTPAAEADDGIRTGWVCVNVGAIEEGRKVDADELQQRGIVGFGEGVSGAHLVVQMMTEEKREELDLEKLWGDALSRHQRKQARDEAYVAGTAQD